MRPSGGSQRPRWKPTVLSWPRAAQGVLLAAGCALGLIGAEALLWASGFPLGEHPQGLFQADSDIGHRLSQNFHGRVQLGHVQYHVSTNSAGMRGPALRPSDQVERRILGLGDSMTYGMGVEEPETYLRRLEHLLNDQRRSGSGVVEVLNGGVPAYGTLQELQYLQRVGLGYAPDLVVLGFYPSTDLGENENPPLRVVEGFLLTSVGSRLDNLKLWLRRHVRVYAFTVTTLKRHDGLRRWLARVGIVARRDPGSNTLRVFLNPAPPEIARQWQVADALLIEMQRLLAARGIPLLVMGIPHRVSVDPELMRRAAHGAGIAPQQLDPKIPHRMLADLCRAHGIPYLDLLAAFERARQEGVTLYFEFDEHLAPGGHDTVAATLATFLATQPQLWTHRTKRPSPPSRAGGAGKHPQVWPTGTPLESPRT